MIAIQIVNNAVESVEKSIDASPSELTEFRNAFENHPAAVNPNRGIDIQLVEHMVREAAEGKSVAL